MKKIQCIYKILIMLCLFHNVQAEPQWEILPPTPTLPKPVHTGHAPINGIKIWYAIYGSGPPVLFLHGALANSNYWGNQVKTLAKDYTIILMDSRGQGRSTHDVRMLSYQLMAEDVIQLLDYLKIKKCAIVGWSDGAIIGLEIAIQHPERVNKLFAFAANSNPQGVIEEADKTSTFKSYFVRTQKEYETISPSPKDYHLLLSNLRKMWKTEPNITAQQLQSIHVPTWIVDGDHDEGIKRENTEYMAAQIPHAGLLIQPWVSHFSFLQDPEQFNNDLLMFLDSHNSTTVRSNSKN